MSKQTVISHIFFVPLSKGINLFQGFSRCPVFRPTLNLDLKKNITVLAKLIAYIELDFFLGGLAKLIMLNHKFPRYKLTAIETFVSFTA